MKRMNKCLLSGTLFFLFLGFNDVFSDQIPWDELSEASWIDFGDSSAWPNMCPINGGQNDILEAYPVAFSPAGGGNKARGMNALKFRHGGQTTGHMVSADIAGAFDIVNTGKNNIFTDILLLVAINTTPEAILGEFNLKLTANDSSFNFSADRFSYYDNVFGRPSGYYFSTNPADPHETNPPVDPIAYAFERGMVVVYALENVTAMQQDHFITVNYVFSNLPGPAAFSIYGYIGTDPLASIYHTNRSFLDANDKDQKPISTFAVTVPGDLNKDLRVDIRDIVLLAQNWLKGTP